MKSPGSIPNIKWLYELSGVDIKEELVPLEAEVQIAGEPEWVK